MSGADFGVKRSWSTKYKQFYVSANGSYKAVTGQYVKVKGRLVGITCAYANTIFGECVGEVVPTSVEKIK